jgi:hypothetical protein
MEGIMIYISFWRAIKIIIHAVIFIGCVVACVLTSPLFIDSYTFNNQSLWLVACGIASSVVVVYYFAYLIFYFIRGK